MEMIFIICFCIIFIYVMLHIVELIAVLTLIAFDAIDDLIYEFKINGVKSLKTFLKNF